MSYATAPILFPNPASIVPMSHYLRVRRIQRLSCRTKTLSTRNAKCLDKARSAQTTPLCVYCPLFTCFVLTLRAGSLSISCVHMLLAVLLRRSMPKTRTFAFRIDVSRPTLPVEGCKLCICAASKRADSVSKAFEMLMFAAMSWASRSGKQCATLQRGLCLVTSYLRTRKTALL